MGGIIYASPICTAVSGNFRKVRVEEYDKESLWAAAQEGRLYTKEPENNSKESIIREVREYVRQLHPLTTDKFREHADDLWERIFACDELLELLMPSTKARKFKAFNKYNVMRIISILREAGVYRQYNDSVFDAILEHGKKDSRYRKFLGKGLEKRSLLMLLLHIVELFDDNTN